MSRTEPPSPRRIALPSALLVLTCLCLATVYSGPAGAQRFSSQFLDVLNEACFADPAPHQQNGQNRFRSRVRVILANSRSNDLSQICAYDLTCGEVAFSGRIERSRRVNFTVCADSRGRGHIVLLDPFGTIVERRNLQSPATIQLGR